MFIKEFYSNMHAIDTCVSRFTTVFYGTRIIVTPDLVSKVLHVPRVDCSDYPSHPHLISISSHELASIYFLLHLVIW